MHFVPMGIAAIASAVAGAQLVTRIGTRAAYIGGSAVGRRRDCSLLSRAGADSGYAADLLPGLVIFGLGLPLVGVSNQIAAVAEVPHEDAGAASGIVTSRVPDRRRARARARLDRGDLARHRRARRRRGAAGRAGRGLPARDAHRRRARRRQPARRRHPRAAHQAGRRARGRGGGGMSITTSARSDGTPPRPSARSSRPCARGVAHRCCAGCAAAAPSARDSPSIASAACAGRARAACARSGWTRSRGPSSPIAPSSSTASSGPPRGPGGAGSRSGWPSSAAQCCSPSQSPRPVTGMRSATAITASRWRGRAAR